MPNKYISSITLANGLVQHATFSAIAAADLPADIAYTDVANVFTMVNTFNKAPTSPFGSGANCERWGAGSGNGPATGDNNTAVGAFAVGSVTTGLSNTGVGLSALVAVKTGGTNTAVGALSLANVLGDGNTGVGYACLLDASGSLNTVIGFEALAGVTTGQENVKVGHNSGGVENLTTGSGNTLVGSLTGTATFNTSFSTAVGYQAVGATRSVAVGYQALLACTTGVDNAAIGSSALASVTSGSSNTAVGSSALTSSTSGSNNCGFGAGAGRSITTGNQNFCLGPSSLQNMTTASFSVAIGFQALSDCTGGSNTAIGMNSGVTLTTGTANTFIGANPSGTFTLRTGDGNILLGSQADTFASDTAFGIALGYQARMVSNECAFGPFVNVQTGYVYSSASTLRPRADFTDSNIDNTDATRKYRRVFNVWDTAQREAIRIDANGTTAQVGVGGAVIGTNLLTVNGTTDISVTTATTNSIVNTVFYDVLSSGTTANQFGQRLNYRMQSANGTLRGGMEFAVDWVDATDATRKARAFWNVYDTAAREVVRIEGTGSAGAIGFFATSAAVQQTYGATITNNVVASGVTNQLDDFTSLTTYATDAQAIHNDIYQLGRAVKLILDALRAYGLLT